LDLGSQRSDRRRVGHVAHDRLQRRVPRLRLVELRLAAAGDDHDVAELEEPRSEGETDTGAAAGDENGVTGELHWRLLELADAAVRRPITLYMMIVIFRQTRSDERIGDDSSAED